MTKKTLLIIILIIVAIGGILWQIKRFKSIQFTKQEQQEIKLPAINGLLVEKTLAQRRPIAVMVENHVDSRPQSGLSDADIVYETLAEGGITRFMALYQTRETDQIGPIRSVRNYFNFLANQWAAVLAHSGGSKDALQELRSNVYRSVTDADEFFNGKYYKRDNRKFPPHNLFSSTTLLRQFAEDKKVTDWQPGSYWSFATIPTEQLKPTITSISIPFMISSYAVSYKFDPTTNSYKRSVAGQPAIDANNKLQLSPTNIIVQFADSFAVEAATEGGIDFNLDTSGSLYLFSGGNQTTGSWSYKNGKLSYVNEAGQPLTIQPGQTWIELVPKSLKTQVTAQ